MDKKLPVPNGEDMSVGSYTELSDISEKQEQETPSPDKSFQCLFNG